MTRIKVETIIWDDRNIIHIKKHSVTKSEAEDAVSNFIYYEQAHSGRYLLVGKSGKRVLSIILDRKSAKTYYVVTARDISKKERKKLNESENL